MGDLDVVTDRDLLRITHTAVGRLRTLRDPFRLDACLSTLDRLERYDGWPPDEYPSTTAANWAALADFARDCSNGAEWLWEWGANAIERHGYDPLYLVLEACMLAGTHEYGHAVASFDPNPNNYRLLPVAGLPLPHTLHLCDHVRAAKEANLVGRRGRGLLKRLFRPIRDLDPDDAARLVHHRVASGALMPCTLHGAVDWQLMNASAEHIRDTVRPWTAIDVVDAIDRLDLSSESRKVLRSLFLVPITWDGRNTWLGNGQHRVCGIRTAGARQAFVNTDG